MLEKQVRLFRLSLVAPLILTVFSSVASNDLVTARPKTLYSPRPSRLFALLSPFPSFLHQYLDTSAFLASPYTTTLRLSPPPAVPPDPFDTFRRLRAVFYSSPAVNRAFFLSHALLTSQRESAVRLRRSHEGYRPEGHGQDMRAEQRRMQQTKRTSRLFPTFPPLLPHPHCSSMIRRCRKSPSVSTSSSTPARSPDLCNPSILLNAHCKSFLIAVVSRSSSSL